NTRIRLIAEGIIMEPVRKQFRKNDNSNRKGDSSDTNLSNEDQELDQTIPTLVSEIFLEELRDVKLLKTCRLVCTSWNIVARSILDFKVLEVIKFGSKFIVSPGMIRHCLSGIPKLKQIELNWNSSFNAIKK
ncbi:unnamed protein product, partial [Allacma fusca]